ncbi:response regulator transcription factor [Phyllobacterium zundukense]|uniref:DNA-binding response regulator n=1 Tax=Phyllobacterium zundukense TaxID=1867719 RepID=A0A2N9W0E2_9HYPH|nr:response regulator transcription factor [Phyllobacterium zundukense]ATU90550.1 DNA-binding response regulator [Phyllobacterium zundukense]PIO45210.1 DNA-binding response regulator [Phyllobacterium zundukense]
MNISTDNSVTAKETGFEQYPIVLVVDDDESLRLSICELLESVGIEAAGFASTQALMDADILDRPGCIILDVRMPGVSGLDFQSRLAASGISASIIFLTGYGDIPMTVQAMKAGAVEFLTKPVRDQTLLDAVSKAIETDKEKRAAQLESNANIALYATLTPRERQVMEAVVRGALSKQIAFDLNISEITVKLHRSSVMKKMKTPFVTHLVRAWQSIPANIRDDYPA